MTAIISKSVDLITADDIKSLVTSHIPEGERMEFKRELPAKGKDNRDPWMHGQLEIGRHAKNKILKEVVSFANAYGGVLVLGIEESKDETPPVAKAICPIPNCEVLAERFRGIFRDRVEPKLPSCDILAVVTDEGGEGVVVFRIPGRSRLAPHRIKGTWICPVRRWDRSEEMSMREIQDMTLNVTRGLERMDKKLQERAARFEHEFVRLTSPGNAYGIRVTAVPVGDDIRLQTICGPYSKLVEGLNTPKVTVKRRLPDRDPTVMYESDIFNSIGQFGWNPQLRAARSRPEYDTLPDWLYFHYLELHCDGLVECGWLAVMNGANIGILSSHLAVQALAHVICWADSLRRYANAGRAEYAVQAAVHVRGNKVPVVVGSTRNRDMSLVLGSRFGGQLPHGETRFPRYALDDVRNAPALLSMFEHDLCNAGGMAFADADLGKFELECKQGQRS